MSWGRKKQPRQMTVKIVVSLGPAGLAFAKLKSCSEEKPKVLLMSFNLVIDIEVGAHGILAWVLCL